MLQFTHIIFDLDGTLTDPRQGIGNSIKYAFDKMDIKGYDGMVPLSFIGPPLQQSFKELFRLDEQQTKRAVEYFREYYSSTGLFENQPYPGILSMLEILYLSGKKLFIATSKLEIFASRIAHHFGFNKYIEGLRGAGYNEEQATKTNIISSLMKKYQLNPSHKIVMVGDTVFDVLGGHQNGLTTISAMYGFGNPAELQSAEPEYWAETVDHLKDLLVGG
jgi:phosphoglycolate phosphatase